MRDLISPFGHICTYISIFEFVFFWPSVIHLEIDINKSMQLKKMKIKAIIFAGDFYKWLDSLLEDTSTQ